MSKKRFQILVADEYRLDPKHSYLSVFPKTSKFKRKNFSYDENKKLLLSSRKLCSNIAEILQDFCYENILKDLKPPLKNIFYPFSYMFINSYLAIFFRVRSSISSNSKDY